MGDSGPVGWRGYHQRLEVAQNRLVHLADHLPESRRGEPGACGAWNARQVLAHLEAWNVEILGNLRELREGAAEIQEHEVDEFNRQAVEARDGWSWTTVMSRLRASQYQIRQHLQSCLREGRSITSDEREWIEVLISHDSHHGDQLERWIRVASLGNVRPPARGSE